MGRRRRGQQPWGSPALELYHMKQETSEVAPAWQTSCQEEEGGQSQGHGQSQLPKKPRGSRHPLRHQVTLFPTLPS